MSKKSLLVLGLVLLAACAEPPLGPSVSDSGESARQVPPRQTCREPGNPRSPSQPQAARTIALAKQCVPIQ
jgi:hypothetical protein